MTYQFSNRMSSLQPSLVREILKATSDPEVIPFACLLYTSDAADEL